MPLPNPGGRHTHDGVSGTLYIDISQSTHVLELDCARARGKEAFVDAEMLDPHLLHPSVGHLTRDRRPSIFDGAFDGVWLVADNGLTIYANEAMAALLGSTPDALRGRPITDFVDESRSAEAKRFLARQRVQPGERMELRFRRVDGSDLLGLVTGTPIVTIDGGFVGTMLKVGDVIGKGGIDALIEHNQRLEAIGQFASGIAHDFNNLLTAIHGYAELSREGLPEGGPVRKDLDQVLAATERAAAITQKLLAFTRRQAPLPVEVDPAQVIADLVPMLRPLLGDDIAVVLDVQAEHGWTRVDPAQLEQVIVNLAVNAHDAMPTGGTLTIGVHDLKSIDPDRTDIDSWPGPFIRISVADTGSGMDAATRARIFDPFYTTKGPGKGTGLGLFTVFGIVAQSGGQIQVETAIGQGSTFNIDLPRLGIAVPSDPPHAAAATSRRSGVVLLVEDDPSVREFVRRSLEATGYTVLVAADADQALRESGGWGEVIDVLVTDIVMPGIHGPELAVLVRAQRPGIGLVLMSGYPDEDMGRDPELGQSCEMLPKPFNLEALYRAVSRAVEADQAPRAQR
jgi:two-component system cell cycle sensor histidine kinase/response regulator CckA